MEYYLLSYSHKNTDISTREKLSLDTKNPKTAKFLKDLVENKCITEAVILSTCNRIEFILNVQNTQQAEAFLLEKLSVLSGIAIESLKKRADSYENLSAIHHLFSVASSLDSLVVGETQIAGQLKNAFKFSYEIGCCGLYLSRAMHYAFRCAASVRNSTSISQNSVSVASTAVAKAKAILGSLDGKEALVIGAGEMSAICAKHLVSANCAVVLMNRDLQNAENVCKSVLEVNPYAKIRAESFKDVGKYINTISLLFSATGAPHTIITADMVEQKDSKRYWFDLAMPRDIAPNIAKEHRNVQIFAVDDLEDIVRKNLALREEQARIAYGIVGRSTQEFFSWLQTLNVEPLIKTIRTLAKDSALKELQKGITKGYLPKDYEKNIEKTLHNAFNVFLHDLTLNLKSVANTPKADSVVESLRFLFGWDSEDKMLESYKCEYAQDKALS
ncbi:glutamyl-tRNA reductase [Helicobacter sp.]|uniref:glutamyl-tRNA reductase n=1 Tax=Helicobacter sp. TaxID=218 RepID=UPI0025BFF336|nr:glutamyl-tRNA reductase [Helicobacter sp.]MCI5969486.1 glutamyl-tRNA reductase [Helicobacter sp.]MDY2584193.1 glutamyl-tRNA reductase [Helicobacter sp.]